MALKFHVRCLCRKPSLLFLNQLILRAPFAMQFLGGDSYTQMCIAEAVMVGFCRKLVMRLMFDSMSG
jgi:hypothetical protein